MVTTIDSGQVGIAGLGLAAITLMVGIYYGRRSVKEKRPVYFSTSVNLVQDVTNRVEGVEVSYHGKPVTTLTVSKIGFWNAGRETILRDDVSDGDPLRIEIEDGVVLDTRILNMTSQAVTPEISGSADSPVVNLSFDYLDRQEGFLVQLMHTGPESAGVAVKGSIKGAGEPRRRDEDPWWLIFGVIFGSFGLAFAVGALAVAIVRALNGPNWAQVAVAILFGVGGFALALLGFVRFDYRITRVPKALSGVRLPRLEKRLPGAPVG